ncbi:uncharacterized protein LOC106132232 isoform X2 [Amyelois transitella]|uniref:uncharacterized protein LOC106132232 isoform X2 n=1 Tax=Amyelois transitella TaxID=680683 RepID=UPI00067D14D5|nr:uncharacterized protein LOC106132232 isoform X2 [Amyelois transitella]
MSKLSFRARALDASKPMPIYLAEELPDLPDYSAINRAVPQMPSGMEKEEESEHHLQRAISGTGLIIPTPEVCEVNDLQFYERCYPPDYKMPKQHIHMQPLWEEQEAPEYDIDSEDERWLKQQRHLELTELKFEQMMDKLEKSSGQTVVTLSEAKLLLERHDELVTAVYDYWLNKRLNTQHPLILSVKTESRPGQSSNNPYLAFRRRTEKMQTRKNRKNDESSYEKMLKLRRDLARALNLLELVARREDAKRSLVALTAQLAEKRYSAGDFANQLLPETQVPRPAITLPRAAGYRHYETPLYTSAAPPDIPRQREKRAYKKRKHRHVAAGAALGLRDSGVYTSSEEETRTEPASPPDDGAFAFRRKPGCYYEMPTSTLYGDPVDTDNPSKDGLFQHEIDPRHRFTLTSLSADRCIGFARRRLGRGGRVILDRVQTPLDTLWRDIPFRDRQRQLQEEKEREEIETKSHRIPKEISRDYHSGGKHPWRHAFRTHFKHNPHLWLSEEIKSEIKSDVKPEPIEVLPQDSDISVSARTMDGMVRENLDRVMRKRVYSDSDSSYDSDESLHPVEREFEQFIDEVNKKWLHFRPKTPPCSPPPPPSPEPDLRPLSPHALIACELRPQEKPPSEDLDTFTTREFTLASLYADLPNEGDVSGNSLDISNEDLLPENFTGLTEAQVESILSETDLKTLEEDMKDEKKLTDNILDLVSDEKPFLLQGQSADRRADSGKKSYAFGSSAVRVSQPPSEPVLLRGARPGGDDLPPAKVEKKEVIEEVQLPHGVQLQTVQTAQSPLKKHIITSAPRRDVQPQIVTVAVSDSIKVRLQNNLLTSTSGVLLPNGPFPSVAVAVPVHHQRETPGVKLSVPGRLKVLHAQPLSAAQAQLLQRRAPAVVSLAPLAEARLKAAPGSVAQFFEIKGGQLARGPHLLNVLRPPPPRRPDDRRRELPAAGKPQRVSLGIDGRAIVRAALPTLPVRPPRQQIQLKSRPLQVTEARVPNTVVANLLQKTTVLPRAGPKIAISGPGGQPLSANVQAIAFTTAQLKGRQARLIPQPRPVPVAEMVEARAPAASSSSPAAEDEPGAGRRRAADALMEVT